MKEHRICRLDKRIELHKKWENTLNDARKYSLAFIDSKNDESRLKSLYNCKQPKENFDDLVKLSAENDYESESINPDLSLSSERLLCELVRLSRSKDETDPSFRAYFYLLNEKDIIDLSEKTIFSLKGNRLSKTFSGRRKI